MAHVYNPRGWQRAPGSSLASQSRLTEGPQVPGRPTLFFFFFERLSQGWFLTSTCMHPYTHICTHNLCTPLVHTKKHYPGINRIWNSSLSAVRIYCWFVCLVWGGVYVCIVLYIPGWPWTHYVRRVMLRFCSFCLHLPVLGHNIHYTQFIWCLG